MSHSKERKEKRCLNCGAELQGRYCHQCGQENIEPRQTIWHLVTHFFYDITHFDGKFFTTVKDLLIKPGFLSKEFILGRRQSYLDPIRMYLFTSAIFFVLFFWLVNVRDVTANAKKNALQTAQTREDSIKVEKAFASIRNLAAPKKENIQWMSGGLKFGISLEHFPFSSFEQYDSVQNLLKPELRDGWIKRSLIRKRIEIDNKFGENRGGFAGELFELFMHHLAQLLFISLPIFALFLKLLYVRRKNFYYSDHAIFAIHLYIFSFIMLMLYFCIQFLESKTDWGWLSAITALIILMAVVYYFIAMKNFYQQGIVKTIIKFLLLSFLSLMMMMVLFAGFGLFSLWEI